MPKNKALVIVPDDQLSLAIGKDGQNVRLAAKLTGWKIDVKSEENKGVVSSVEEEEEDKEEEKPKKETKAKPKKEEKAKKVKKEDK